MLVGKMLLLCEFKYKEIAPQINYVDADDAWRLDVLTNMIVIFAKIIK